MYRVQNMLEYAIRAACESSCSKSKRGVIIWNPHLNTYTTANNSPPLASSFQCDGSDECKANCGKVAVHAEDRALRQWLMINGIKAWSEGTEMLHVKVVDGKAVPSGEPSCWQCSRIIADQKGIISGMWLLHEDGLKRYDPIDFHRITLKNCNLYCFECTN